MDRRYDTYLLRWWHSDGGERAEVQHIQTGERTALPSLAAACSWLLTRYDEAVVPYTAGFVEAPNATNIVVQDGCALDYAEHARVAADPIAATHVLNALDPANPRPVPCFFVPPFTG